MRVPATTRRALSLSVVATLLASCVEPDRVSAPVPRAPDPPVAAKQGPTGSRILFLRSGSLFSMDDDGTRQIELRSPGVSSASWAPDGKRILVSIYTAGGGRHVVYLMNEDGTGLTQLTHPAAGQSDINPRAVGKVVVFERIEVVGAYGQGFLWAVDPETLGETQLTSELGDGSPAGAPSGKLFAFARGGDVYVYEMATGAITNLTRTPDLHELSPSWAPGGKLIAFTRASLIGGDIYVMNADGTAVTQLTFTDDRSESHAAWSPDGKRLAFTRMDGQQYDVWVMDADGSNQINLTNTSTEPEVVTAWAR